MFDSTAIIVRSIQEAVRDVGDGASDSDAAYVIGMALNQALAHAAPDVPPENTLISMCVTATTTPATRTI